VLGDFDALRVNYNKIKALTQSTFLGKYKKCGRVNNHMQMKFMRLAIKEALFGVKHNHGGPFGAVVVCKGKVIASAHNTVLKDKDATCHAEVNVIRKASKKLKKFDLKGCEIYATCEPCPMCFSAIHWANIKKIYYGASLADSKKAGFNELDISAKEMRRNGKSKVSLEEKVLCEECLVPFDEFKKKKGKRY